VAADAPATAKLPAGAALQVVLEDADVAAEYCPEAHSVGEVVAGRGQ